MSKLREILKNHFNAFDELGKMEQKIKKWTLRKLPFEGKPKTGMSVACAECIKASRKKIEEG